jgi:DNA-binding MarR family transcriptional regulator
MDKRLRKHQQSTANGSLQIAFLLAQIGAHAASKFAERIAKLRLSPSHAGVMRILSQSEGISQRELCAMLSMVPSRLVVLLDELQAKEIIERRDDPSDRRSYSLYLTEKGKALLESVRKIAREHNESVCEGLNAAERKTLGELLARVAKLQGLTPGVHPGYKWLGWGKRKKKAEP